MAAVYVSNIVINSNCDFFQVYELERSDTSTVLDISGYDVKSQLRKHHASSNSVNFDCSILNPIEGKIKIGLTTSITSNLKPGRYIYDVIITEPYTGIRTKVIEGMALVREGATKI